MIMHLIELGETETDVECAQNALHVHYDMTPTWHDHLE